MKTLKSDRTPFLSFVTCFSFAAGILLSPDMIAMIGNFMGNTGYWGLISIALSAVVYLFLSRQYQAMIRLSQHVTSDSTLFQTFWGPIAIWVPVAVKFTALLFLATGFLVSSGFVFNETFVYWFPNFGFAFLLLFILVLIQFAPVLWRSRLQILFSGLSIFGLLILIIAGFLIPDKNIAASNAVSTTTTFQWPVFLIPILFFIGMDMGFFMNKKTGHEPNYNAGLTIIIMAILAMAWGVTAIDSVSLQKLSQTSISHIIIARTLLGDVGRIIMGIVVISGTLAALNALFTHIHFQVADIFKTYSIKKTDLYSRLFVLFSGICIGVLMARGLAGYDVLETLVRASLILWIFFYGWLAILSFITNQKQKSISTTIIPSLIVILPFMGSVIIFILSNIEPKIIIYLIGIALFTSFGLGAIFSLLTTKKNKLEMNNDTF